MHVLRGVAGRWGSGIAAVRRSGPGHTRLVATVGAAFSIVVGCLAVASAPEAGAAPSVATSIQITKSPSYPLPYVDDSYTLQATVFDQSAAPVQTPTAVTFTVIAPPAYAGTLPPAYFGDGSTSETDVTGVAASTGVATATLTAGSFVGRYRVVATVKTSTGATQSAVMSLRNSAYETCSSPAPAAWGWGEFPGQSDVSNSITPAPVTTGDGSGSTLPCGATVTSVASGGNNSGEDGKSTLANGTTAALTNAGWLYAWGDDQYGQAGISTSDPNVVADGGEVYVATREKPAGSDLTFTSVAEGNRFSLGLTASGKVYAWGYAGDGALGDGSLAGNDPCFSTLDLPPNDMLCQNTPQLVSDIPLPPNVTVVAIAAEGNDALVLTSAGTVYGWGSTSLDQLGLDPQGGENSGSACYGTAVCEDTPVQVDMSALPQGDSIQSIVGGGDYALLLTSAGTVYGWGSTAAGELGVAPGGGDACGGGCQDSPIAVAPTVLTSVTALSAGYDQALASTGSGAVYSWGDNSAGELGTGSSATDDPTPTQVTALTGVTGLSAGDDFDLVTTTGGPAVWGSTGDGELTLDPGSGNACGGDCQNTPLAVTFPAGSTVAGCSTSQQTCTVAAGEGQSTVIVSPTNAAGNPPCGSNPGPGTCLVVPPSYLDPFQNKTVTLGATGPCTTSLLASTPDATEGIYDWVNAVVVPADAAASPADPIEVQFQPDYCYPVSGVLLLRGLHDVIFDGANPTPANQTGTTFVQLCTTKNSKGSCTKMSPVLPSSDVPPTLAPYCSDSTEANTASFASSALAWARKTDIMFDVDGGCDLEFANMSIVGAGETFGSSYGPVKHSSTLEQNSAFQFSGSQRVQLTNSYVVGAEGDCATVFGLGEATTPGNYPASDVTINGDTCQDLGRDGVSVVYANRVSIGTYAGGNTFTDWDDSGVDIEADAGNPVGGEGNLLVQDNTFTKAQGCTTKLPCDEYLMAGDTTGQVFNVAFDNNTVDKFVDEIEPTGGLFGQNFTIEDNTANDPDTSKYVDDWMYDHEIGGLVAGNTECNPATAGSGCKGFSVGHFVDTGGAGGSFIVRDNVIYDSGSKTLPVYSSQGVTASADVQCQNLNGSGGVIGANDGYENCQAPNLDQQPIQPVPASLPDLVDIAGLDDGAMIRPPVPHKHKHGKTVQRAAATTGEIVCSNVTGTANFDPPLSTASQAPSEMALIDVTIGGCETAGGQSVSTTGTGVMEIPLPTSNCGGLSAGLDQPVSLAVSWTGGSVATSEIVFPGFSYVTGSSPSLLLQGNGAGVDVNGSLTLNTSVASLAAACKSAAGLASIGFSGGVVQAPQQAYLSVPDAPIDVTATVGAGQATVSWAPPVNVGGATATAYTATSDPGGLTCTTTGATSCTVTGLSPGVTYTFNVTATNRVGTGPASAPSAPVVAGP